MDIALLVLQGLTDLMLAGIGFALYKGAQAMKKFKNGMGMFK